MSLLRQYSDIFSLLDETSRVPQRTNRRGAFSPSFDVHETEQSYILEGELPGLHDKSNLSIEFTDPQTLLVRGKTERSHQESSDGNEPAVTKKDKKEGQQEAKGGTEEKDKDSRPRYWVSERAVGEFQRSFSFPSYVDMDAVKASLAHGILKIVVPKKQSQIAKRIEIS
ncbi:HSP20-like chaperone [Tuber brumale]|nr:HSP20-like chaperone [Tuber brumale]